MHIPDRFMVRRIGYPVTRLNPRVKVDSKYRVKKALVPRPAPLRFNLEADYR